MALKFLFFQKITKNRSTAEGFASRPQSLRRLGACPQTPRLCYVCVTLAFSKRLQSYVFALFNYISLSSLPLQNPG